jgi:hypothetical protein
MTRGFAMLLLDLLTAEEEAVDVRTVEYRFDAGDRVPAWIDWFRRHPRGGGRAEHPPGTLSATR